jgi:glutathione synthase/RimK-type ligase-like ATP-grasp enzyme
VILVISHPRDEHARAVLGELEKLGAESILLDLTDVPQRYRLAAVYDSPGERSFQLIGDNRPSIDLDRCAAIWWRRPQAFSVHAEITDRTSHTFALTEATEAFAGLWQALDAWWINPPANDANAHRKVFQLRVAQDVGLSIPATLVTSDPARARAFIETHGIGRTIYKAFSGTREAWRETRLVKQEELHLLDSVRYAPVIFQHYIEATVDLRVTVVGDDIFPAALFSQQSAYPIDFRMDMANTRIESHQMPDEILVKLRELMRRLGLVYGAIDMRLTPQGEYVFLEINPAGQWLFIEAQSKQPISATIAAWLARHDQQQPP